MRARITSVLVGVGVSLALCAGCRPHVERTTSPGVGAAVTAIVATAAEHPDDTDAQVAALAALGAPAIEPLALVLRHPDARIRSLAVEALGRMKREQALDPLLGVLGDPSWEVRQQVVEALGQLRSARAVEPLIDQYARDEEAVVRYECLTSLGLLGDRRATPLLVGETRSADPYARMWAMQALCTARDPEASALLAPLLQDPDVKVRRQVMRSCGLAARTDAGRRLLLRMALDDRDFETSYLARENLAADARSTKDAGARSVIAEEARRAMASPDRDRARRGAFLLANIGDRRAFDSLVVALRDPSPMTRHHAAYLLGEIQDPRAVRPLVGALEDAVPVVRLTALVSLRRYAAAGSREADEAIAAFQARKAEPR